MVTRSQRSYSSCQFWSRRAITPCDRSGCSEKERQRILQIPHRNAPQIKNRQLGIEATRPAPRFGQDVRAESDFRRSRCIGGAILNLLTLEGDWTDPGLNKPF
jgi:hypothetical protein